MSVWELRRTCIVFEFRLLLVVPLTELSPYFRKGLHRLRRMGIFVHDSREISWKEKENKSQQNLDSSWKGCCPQMSHIIYGTITLSFFSEKAVCNWDGTTRHFPRKFEDIYAGSWRDFYQTRLRRASSGKCDVSFKHRWAKGGGGGKPPTTTTDGLKKTPLQTSYVHVLLSLPTDWPKKMLELGKESKI